MANQKVPVKHYQQLSKLFPETISALEHLGSAIHNSGPIKGKQQNSFNWQERQPSNRRDRSIPIPAGLSKKAPPKRRSGTLCCC